jgi:DNA-binding CsgD family transcriptional regulator
VPEQLWGRDAELAQLVAALDAADAGRPGLVVVAGEPGIGKTSLLQAASRRTRAGWTAIWTRGLAAEATPALWLWRQALGSVVEGRHDRFALFESLRQGLVARAPVLLAIDDIQWLDESSLRTLTYVLRRFSDERMLVAAALRTDDVSPGWRAAGAELLAEMAVRRIDLAPLDAGASVRCLEAAYGSSAPQATVEEALALARGNPFFLAEIGRSWAAGPERGVPRSVTDIVRRRLARLANPAQEFLLAAAVVGEDAEIAVVAHCLGRSVTGCLPAVQDALDAQFVIHTRPGSVRFGHALLRSALLEMLPMQRLVALHGRAAEAIEELYADALDEHLADLARHAAAVAVTGNRAPAVNWAEQAAQAAIRQLAYEDAARLAQLALDSGGPGLADATRDRLLLLRARADWHAGRLQEAFAACRSLATDAREAGDGRRLADAALTVEPIGELGWDRELRDWCLDALPLIAESDTVLRARITARLAEAHMYVGDFAAALEPSAAALRLADEAADDDALVFALRARQLTVSGPDHREERMLLAARMTDLGQRLRRPDVEMWGRLWTIDALWERGRLAGIAAELTNLRWCVDRIGSPMAQWHWLLAAAALAQARGEYDEALRLGGAAFEITRALRHPAGFGAYLALLSAVGRHRGYPEMALTPQSGLEPDPGEMRARIFAHLGPAFALADAGRLVEAGVLYRRPGPPQSWDMPPFFRVSLCAVGAHVAIDLGLLDDVRFFRDLLLPHRAAHVVTGSGTGNYLGPVELILGRCAAALGDDVEAEAALRRAVEICTACATPGFLVEAQYELGRVLLRRQRRIDAGTLFAAAQALAEQYGMTRWVERIVAARREPDDPLTARERQVAILVAEGRTNRQIAEELVVSERTAANHVQHVLAKLGFARRSEIAAWLARQ